ncbi:hypothetical protein COT72_05645 [archaeon CG10_big_fil_rev_8_21_14_0_10_43_11]|nr:MAG: hypothetical protein COT72_05645 [archaeon CG10_big_fil_rev_8_21_14_0_10_43_11]
MKKGIVYTTGITMLMIFLYISIGILVTEYNLHQESLHQFLTAEKTTSIISNIKHAYYNVLGIEGDSQNVLRMSFPLANDSALKNESVTQFGAFINTLYKVESFTNISLNTSEAQAQLTGANNTYVIGDDLVFVYESNNSIVLPSNALSSLAITLVSDAESTANWDVSYVPGPLNVTFDDGSAQTWFVTGQSGVLNVTLTRTSYAGYVAFNFTPSTLIIDGSNVLFSIAEWVNLTIHFQGASLKPAYASELSAHDYLNEVRVNTRI